MNAAAYKKKQHIMGAGKRRRGHGLFGLVCVSLCIESSTSFVNLLHPSRQNHQQQLEFIHHQTSSSLSVLSTSSSPFTEFESRNTNGQHIKRRTNSPLLSPVEEAQLLARAVEYRRLNQLEKDMALMHHNSLPPLVIRAKEAGYGEDLDGYEDAKFEGQLARETLVTHNMGLVHHCVNKIIGKESFMPDGKTKYQKFQRNKGLPLNSLSREDLVQEGAIGLARAVDKWNPEIGGKFSTYAVYWVRAAILRCIAERDDVVRIPNHVGQAVLQINKAAKRLGWVLQDSGGILVTDQAECGSSAVSMACNSPRWKAANAAKRLAEEAGLSESRFEEAMTARRRRYSGGYVPFESWMQKTTKNGAILSHKHQSDENVDHFRQQFDSSVDNEEIRTVLSKHLRPKEMEALSWRYGLLREEDQVQQESRHERVNRQFKEMEDQLFGPSAVTVAPIQASQMSLARPKSTTNGVKAKFEKPMTKTPSVPSKKGRFGEAMTFTEVGKKMQVSAEYTRRLCHKALNKLQQAAEDGTLEPALLCS